MQSSEASLILDLLHDVSTAYGGGNKDEAKICWRRCHEELKTPIPRFPKTVAPWRDLWFQLKKLAPSHKHLFVKRHIANLSKDDTKGAWQVEYAKFHG